MAYFTAHEAHAYLDKLATLDGLTQHVETLRALIASGADANKIHVELQRLFPLDLIRVLVTDHHIRSEPVIEA